MTKQIPILQGKVLLIELPEGVAKVQDSYANGFIYTMDDGYVETWYADEDGGLAGNWRIIGMLSEVTEEHIAYIVDSISVICTDGTEYGGWRNYVYRDDFDEDILLNTALESLESAILAEGYAWNNPYGTNTLYYTDKFTGEKKVRVDWAELQSRVLDRSRCLLLGREG